MEGYVFDLGGHFQNLLAAGDFPPSAIVLHCALGGIGMFLLLPSHRSAAMRVFGTVLLFLGLFGIAARTFLHGQSGPSNGFFFWAFSAIAVIGAVRVVTHPRPVYSALYFVLTVFASAGLFVLLSADFLAAALVLIYAGAILVTYVFVIMLATQASTVSGTSRMGGLADYDLTSREPVVAVAVGFALIGVLTFLVFDKPEGLIASQPMSEMATTQPTQALGNYLFQTQVVNLELAGLILTLAMIGAIIIARRRVIETPAIEAQAEEVLGPATPVNDDPHSIPVVGTRNPAQKAYPET
jgi:NADH-quinone oxidoreductase subunit J